MWRGVLQVPHDPICRARVSEELDVPATLLRLDGHVAWIDDGQQDLPSQLRACSVRPSAERSCLKRMLIRLVDKAIRCRGSVGGRV